MDRVNVRKAVEASLLIAGTTIGVGMLGLPLASCKTGFFPSLLGLILVWLFMVSTAFLYLEVALTMPLGSHILSMTEKYLGKTAKWIAMVIYVLSYLASMFAYFSAGVPLLVYFFPSVEAYAYLLFGSFFAGIVFFGVVAISRVNALFVCGMVIAYTVLIHQGQNLIEYFHLSSRQWCHFFLPVPVLFSAFGFQGIIPTLVTHCERSKKTMTVAIWGGTFFPLIVYIIWQILVLGSFPSDHLQEIALKGGSAAACFLGQKKLIQFIVNSFAFFAVGTALLGMSMGMVDFLHDAFKQKKTVFSRFLLTLLAYLPAGLASYFFRGVFLKALSFQGGVGGAFLNGLLAVLLVYSLRKKMGQKRGFFLLFLGLFSIFVIGSQISRFIL